MRTLSRVQYEWLRRIAVGDYFGAQLLNDEMAFEAPGEMRGRGLYTCKPGSTPYRHVAGTEQITAAGRDAIACYEVLNGISSHGLW